MRILRTPVTAAATAAAAVIIALTGCDPDTADTGDTAPDTEDSGTDAADTAPDTADDAAGDMEITSHGHADHELWGPDAYVVTYEITNTGDEAASYFVGFEFVDADGDHLGQTGITVDHLGPGKSTESDTAPLDVEIDHGDIADIADVRIGQVDRTDG